MLHLLMWMGSKLFKSWSCSSAYSFHYFHQMYKLPILTLFPLLKKSAKDGNEIQQKIRN